MKVSRPQDKESTKSIIADANLGESSEMFQLLVEAVKDYAIFILDTKGFILTWNKGAHRLKGYESKEVIGTHFSRFYTQPDIDRNHPQFELDEAIKHGSYEEEGWRVRKDGTRFWASVTITAMRDKEGVLHGFAKVTRDLTEKKKVEDELREAYGSLEARVKERTAELAKAVRARDEFLSIASHELKTPMTSLKLHIQIRKRNLEKGNLAMFTPDRLQQMFEDDAKQVTRINRLVDDMLDITRLSAGKFTLQKDVTDLGALVHDVLRRFAPQLETQGIEIKLQTTLDAIGVWDYYRIEQVFTNLLTNAMKYGDGKPIHITITRESGMAKLCVKDFGIGISAEDQTRVFQQFERAVSPNSISGLGLGLYIVKQIVEAHGGEISVVSEPLKGSTFVVKLPLKKD